jgi:hypothetical protein
MKLNNSNATPFRKGIFTTTMRVTKRGLRGLECGQAQGVLDNCNGIKGYLLGIAGSLCTALETDTTDTAIDSKS